MRSARPHCLSALILTLTLSWTLTRRARLVGMASTYAHAARRWAQLARQVTRDLKGEDSLAYQTWTSAIDDAVWGTPHGQPQGQSQPGHDSLHPEEGCAIEAGAAEAAPVEAAACCASEEAGGSVNGEAGSVARTPSLDFRVRWIDAGLSRHSYCYRILQ